MENSWINPLCHDGKKLINLSTGILAPTNVERDLLNAHKVGQQAYQIFREDRLEKDPSFNDTLKKQKLKTSLNIMRKQAGNKAQGKQIELKADRNLANADESLRKPNKAALARELEKTVSPEEAIPEPSACIIDGMNLVRKLKGDGETFAQLVDPALNLALHEGTGSVRIDVVFDLYRETSIKNAERSNRGITAEDIDVLILCVCLSKKLACQL